MHIYIWMWAENYEHSKSIFYSLLLRNWLILTLHARQVIVFCPLRATNQWGLPSLPCLQCQYHELLILYYPQGNIHSGTWGIYISNWSHSNINFLLADSGKQFFVSCWNMFFLWGNLIKMSMWVSFSSPVTPGLINELTNERGFACPGLSLRERLISIQYAKLLRTQDFIQALSFPLQTRWPALRPLGPALILQDPMVNILRLIHLSSQINY